MYFLLLIIHIIIFLFSDIYFKLDALPERTFRTKLHIIDGDKWTSELADQSSLRFQHKAKFYKTGIDAIVKQSDLKSLYLRSEVLALDGYVNLNYYFCFE